MLPWTFYPAFIGTIISILSLSHLARTEHTGTEPRTLSELAAAEHRLLIRFRNILLFCGVLFAITLFGFVIPHLKHHLMAGILAGLVIVAELLTGLVPAKDRTIWHHEVITRIMAIGMVGLPYLFWYELGGVYALLEAIIAMLISLAGLMTIFDRKHFIFYELPFIFLSHISILTAACALR